MSEDLANQRTLGALMRARAQLTPASDFLRFEGRSLTFIDAERQTDAIAALLRKAGVQRGEHVAVMVPNGFAFALLWIGIAKLGAVIVPLNPDYQQQDLAHVLKDSRAAAIVSLKEAQQRLAPVQPLCPELRIQFTWDEQATRLAHNGESSESSSDRRQPFPIDAAITGQSLLNLQYTSGTTGMPKGCMLTHEYWLRLAGRSCELFEASPSDVNLSAQPCFYMDPQWNIALALLSGAPLVLLPRFDANTFWRTIADQDVSFFYCIGTMPMLLHKQPVNEVIETQHRLRVVYCSGIPPHLHAEFERRWAVRWREAFGMTETGVDLVVPQSADDMVGSGAVGWPVPGKEIRIVSPDKEDVPDGQSGELWIKGKPMMLGYWNQPEATRLTIQDGWLRTGDLAFKDEKGAVHLVGRVKDMIRRGGQNISSAEVESALCDHEAVGSAAVMAVPDDTYGEEVMAFILVPPGAAEHDAIKEPAQLRAFVSERLARFKLPRYFCFVKEFPLTASFRVEKPKLLQRSRDQKLPVFDTKSMSWGTL